MDEAAAVFGLVVEHKEPELFKVHPDAWPAVLMFCRLMRQSAPVGLELSILPWILSLEPVDDPLTLLDDLQIMEREVLTVMHERGG